MSVALRRAFNSATVSSYACLKYNKKGCALTLWADYFCTDYVWADYFCADYFRADYCWADYFCTGYFWADYFCADYFRAEYFWADDFCTDYFWADTSTQHAGTRSMRYKRPHSCTSDGRCCE